MKNDKNVTFCKCGCGNGVVLKADKDEDELSLQFVSDVFYCFTRNREKMSIKERLKRIWYIVIGKEYCYFDILISKEELQEFKDFVSKL